jgi:hypothetical protein
MLLWSAGIATTCRIGIAYDRNEWPNQALHTMPAALGVIAESGRCGRGSHV